MLNLSSCGFSGPLPDKLLKLTQPTTLDLSFNQLEGEIQDGLFRIETIRLAGNTLTYDGEAWQEEPDEDELGVRDAPSILTTQAICRAGHTGDRK